MVYYSDGYLNNILNPKQQSVRKSARIAATLYICKDACKRWNSRTAIVMLCSLVAVPKYSLAGANNNQKSLKTYSLCRTFYNSHTL